MNCKKCGHEIDKKAVICPNCGCKIKKPIFKKWWVWIVVAIVGISIATSGGNDEPTATNDKGSVSESSKEIVYEVVDLQTMFDELDANAMKAENNYQKKNIELVCQIASFDSDGDYISVKPLGASEWDFSSAMCYIKNDVQKSFLVEKNVGDTITIKGRVKSIGEVMGYSIDINEVY